MKTYFPLKSFWLTLIPALGLASVMVAQTETLTSASAANYRPIVAPNSIVTAWGTSLASTTAAANVTDPGPNAGLPTSLGNVRLAVTGSSQIAVPATLYLVSPGQINYVLPATAALGADTVAVFSNGTTLHGPVLVSNISPAIFTVDGSGAGMPAGQVLRVNAEGQSTANSLTSTTNTDISPGNSPGDQVYLVLYGTGFRNHSLNPVIATAGGIAVPVPYAGAQNEFPGLDQINLGPLPPTLAGIGTVNLTMAVDGVPANTVQITFR